MLMTFIKNFLCYVLLIGITIFCVFPIAWIVKTSFETPEYIRSSQIQWVPIKFTWDNYVRVLKDPNAQILRSFGNSLIVSISSTLLSLVMTTMAGYALSRWKFRGKHALNIYLLLVNLVHRHFGPYFHVHCSEQDPSGEHSPWLDPFLHFFRYHVGNLDVERIL